MSTPSTETSALPVDPICAAAVELARAAALEEAAGQSTVGDHLGCEASHPHGAVHRFACTLKGYVGWAWTVTMSCAPGSEAPTVDEVVLLPADQAVLAPAWVPWAERVKPGDLGVGDVMPTPEGDPRLVLRQEDVDEASDAQLWLELGLGRPRVLSREGRDLAAERWYDGDSGPEAPIAKAAPGLCRNCGFHVRLVGALGQVFGVCANEWSPEDAKVTSTDHGCGAHSEAKAQPTPLWDAPTPTDYEYDYVDVAAVDAETPPEAEVPAEADSPAESEVPAEAEAPAEVENEAVVEPEPDPQQ